MLELKLPETGTGVSSYQSEDFKYSLLLNLECIGLSGSDGKKIRFSMNPTNPKYPYPIVDAMEYVLPNSILQEEGYQSAKAMGYNGGCVEHFVKHYVTKQLADLIAESVKEEDGKLLLSGPENISNSYYAHRDVYVLPAISGVGIVDIRAGTCPGYFVRAFCSDEIDNARKERIKGRVISQFVKSL